MDPLTIPPREVYRNRDVSYDDRSPSYQNDSESHGSDQPQQDSFIVEIFKFSILALFIVLPFRFFVAQPFIVSGASMDPTFETGEYLIVDQITYRFEQPQRGDVVVFRYPSDPSKFFIKRIIGLPGEVVQLANGYTTIVNPITGDSTVLDEPYLKKDRTNDHLSITLSSGEYFVMGDNRSQSSDSRMWGPVPDENIVGRALVRLLPPRHFGVFPGAYHYEVAPQPTGASSVPAESTDNSTQ